MPKYDIVDLKTLAATYEGYYAQALRVINEISDYHRESTPCDCHDEPICLGCGTQYPCFTVRIIEGTK